MDNNTLIVKNAEGEVDTQAQIIIQNKIDYTPKVSVIIPVYNTEEYLRECMDSVVGQTLKEIEIICVDDGSTDGSLEILNEYAEKDRRITVITQENQGAGIARNCGISVAAGEFIAFMDSDDLYPKNETLETMYVRATENNVLICGGSLNQIRDGELVTAPAQTYKSDGKLNYFDYQYDYGYYRFVFKRNFLIENQIYFPNYKRFQDPPFFVKSMALAKEFYALKEVTYTYRKSHKQVAWTEEKIYHLLSGLKDNLLVAVKYDLDKLYDLTLTRINKEYKAIIAKEKSERTETVKKEILAICLENARKRWSLSTLNPKVSVIIPTYNVEPYLRECMDSVINQTLKDIEIIAVDDGSTDNSSKIIDEYAKNDNRIKAIHKINGGYGHSMNIGLEAATGEYIGILEPDDFVKLDMYETLYNKAKEFDLDVVKSDYFKFDSDNGAYKYTKEKLSDKPDYYNVLMSPNDFPDLLLRFTTNWAGIFKRDFLQKFNIRHNETPGAAYQDNGFWVQTMYQAKRIMFLENNFYCYRQDNPNQSMRKRNNLWTIPDEYDFIDKVFENNNAMLKYRKIYCYRKFNAYTFHLKARISPEYWTEYLTRMAEVFRKEEEQGYLDFSCFSESAAKELRLILEKNFDGYRHLNIKALSVIISLTSYPARISTVNQTIESLLSQSMKADKVILWLAPEQFPNKEADLPRQLLDLRERGLTIDWYHDIRSYKKLIPALKKYPDAIIVTADDDLLYDRNWLKLLYDSYMENPNDINCHRAHRFEMDSGEIKPYTKWRHNIHNTGASYLNFCTSGAGCLYPPHCFNNEIFNEAMFKAVCKNADDIWFWAMVVLNHKKIRVINNNIPNLKYIDGTQETALWNTNKVDNDRYIANVIEAYPEILNLLEEETDSSPLLYKDIGLGCNTWCEPRNVSGNAYTYDLSDNIYTRYVSWDPIKEGSCDVEILRLSAVEKRSGRVVEFPVDRIISSGKITGSKVEFRNQKCWIGCAVEGAYESFTVEAVTSLM